MRRLAVLVGSLALVGVLALPGIVGHAAATFAAPAFQQQWDAGEAITPNFWGPLSAAKDGQQEEYKEAAAGTRTVQYFDKGRMELTNGTVTNGLLASEITKGQLQTGDTTFQAKDPPAIAIAGDATNPGPTYAGLAGRGKAIFQPAPGMTGKQVTVTVSAASDLSADPGGANPNPDMAFSSYDNATQHNVPRAFAAYRSKAGLATIGLAIAEPFRADLLVGGQRRTVVVQIFERRVLTYTEGNPDAFKVEMGNIGQHYYQWRYGSAQPGALFAATPTTGATRAPAASPTTTGPPPTATRPALLLTTPFVPVKTDGNSCRDFASQAAAQSYLRFYPDDPSNLDPDRNGIACEDNPPPYETHPVKRP